MTVHAFVGESRRGRLYIVAVAVANPADLAPLRRALRDLLLPGSRELHFRKEKDARRRAVADAIARLPVQVTVYSCGCGRSDEPARQTCLARLTDDLLARGAHRR